MTKKFSFCKDVAEATSVKAAIIENDLAYQAVKNGKKQGGSVSIVVDADYLDKKFDFMSVFDCERNEDGTLKKVLNVEDTQDWLCELENARFITFEYSEDAEYIFVTFKLLQYLLERNA